MPLLSEGQVIDARYAIVGRLGEGGMGVVYRARHVELGTDLALKTLRDEALADEELVARFHREARAASALRSEHVARVFDVGRLPSGAPYIVMEFLSGNDLDVELGQRGRLPIVEATQILVQACEAMKEAHAAGIVHRDLKPANLFLAKQGDRRTVKVLDFGISQVARPNEARLTSTTAAFGTPHYMSPEALLSTKHVDARTDVWALGVILFEMLTGQLPFSGETATAIAVAVSTRPDTKLSAVLPDAPRALEALIARALDKDPTTRLPSAEQFADALAPFARGDFTSIAMDATVDSSGLPQSDSGSVGAPPTRLTDAATARTLLDATGRQPAVNVRSPGLLAGLVALGLLGVVAVVLHLRSPAPASHDGAGTPVSTSPPAPEGAPHAAAIEPPSISSNTGSAPQSSATSAREAAARTQKPQLLATPSSTAPSTVPSTKPMPVTRPQPQPAAPLIRANPSRL